MKSKIYATILTLSAVVATNATPAQAGCWKAEEARAAKVRDMETMLMVTALRCRTSASSFMDRYNAFVVGNRTVLTAINASLRNHYAERFGKAGSLNAYDGFVTKIANRYGAGVDGLNCADMSSIMDAVASEATSIESLSAVADRASVVPQLDEPVCSVRMATTIAAR